MRGSTPHWKDSETKRHGGRPGATGDAPYDDDANDDDDDNDDGEGKDRRSSAKSVEYPSQALMQNQSWTSI